MSYQLAPMLSAALGWHATPMKKHHLKVLQESFDAKPFRFSFDLDSLSNISFSSGLYLAKSKPSDNPSAQVLRA